MYRNYLAQEVLPCFSCTSNTHVLFINSAYMYILSAKIPAQHSTELINDKKIKESNIIISISLYSNKHFVVLWSPCCHSTIYYRVWFAHAWWYINTTLRNVLQWSRFFLLGVLGVQSIVFSHSFSIYLTGSDSHILLPECEEAWIVFFSLNSGCIEICVKIEIEN